MDVVNHSAGLIASYHMLDAVARRMFTPCDDIAFTITNTNTISGVLSSSSSCHQTSVFFAVSLNLLRSSNEYRCFIS